MNVVLWVLQALLAAFFLAAGASHLLMPMARLKAGAPWTEDVGGPRAAAAVTGSAPPSSKPRPGSGSRHSQAATLGEIHADMVEEVPSVVGPRAVDAPPAGAVSIVRATAADEPALRVALYEAVCWRDTPSRRLIEDVLADPAVPLYLEDWGRPGDVGFVAEDASGRRGGAAWYRLFTTDRHGYGFVSPDVPEVSMGLQRSWRGLGLGRSLLESLHAVALDAGVPRLSLSVEMSNLRAVRLYKQFGYVPRGIVGTSHTMEVQLLPEAVAAMSHRGP